MSRTRVSAGLSLVARAQVTVVRVGIQPRRAGGASKCGALAGLVVDRGMYNTEMRIQMPCRAMGKRNWRWGSAAVSAKS